MAAMKTSRRNFLKTSIVTGAAASAAFRYPAAAFASESEKKDESTACACKGKVSLTAGEDHPDIIFKGLKNFESQIEKHSDGRRIVVKPNNVAIDNQLCATHADSIEGILEFFKSIGRTDVIVAESAASGPTFEGFDNYGYFKLKAKFPEVKYIDLDKEEYEMVYVVSDEDFHPRAVRMSKMLLDPASYVVSAAVMKTHDRVVATLSLKNIVFGAPIKDEGFRWGPGGKAGAKNDKPVAHGGGFRGVNYNLFANAFRLAPDLAVIDGYRGMEGNGPVGGTPVEHRIAVVSPDWLAADRVGIELMGIDFANVGYLNYATNANLGEGHLDKIEVIGEMIADHAKKYKLHQAVERQMLWKQPMG
ncbi:MAG: DUF362 domain-containing protein [Candidatus Omnitrophota bacterium]